MPIQKKTGTGSRLFPNSNKSGGPLVSDSGGPPTSLEERFSNLEAFAQEAITIINNQGEGLKSMGSRLGEMQFKIGKMDQVIHMQRLALRSQRDKFNAYAKSMIALGIIDEEVLQVAYDIVEAQILPITAAGRVNGGVYVSRYNPPKDMPIPNGAQRT